MQRKPILIVFDLDETLIHSRVEPLDKEPDFRIDPLQVYLRPHATELIEAAAARFDIAVWSAGSPAYVDRIVEKIVPAGINPIFVWNREDCVRKFEYFPFQVIFAKDLKRTEEFGYDLSTTLIIEDDPYKIQGFKDNAIIVSQFFGDNDDGSLSRLIPFIETMEEMDVRELDKGNWALGKD
ncbi:MAG: HAD family hydrolase [Candidatus Melainabacteria bacterium]|nr:HAD family hydrolase [Candidatus Melainabacteria bacterium]